MRDIRMIIELNRNVLPVADEARLTALSRENNAKGALRRSIRLYDSGDTAGARAQLREALRTSHSPGTVAAAAETVARIAWRVARRSRRGQVAGT